MGRGPVYVEAGREAAYAERLASAASVPRRSLALVFTPTRATSADLLVEGAQFYPPMLRDINGATTSIHINQFGFKPGQVGDQFAEALMRKARDGVTVRVLVDARGSDPDGTSRELYQQLAAAGVQICVTWALKLRAPWGPLGSHQETRWTADTLGHIDHRKMMLIDGRIGWVGGAGFEDHFLDGRFHDLFVRVEGPIVHQLQLIYLASLRWLGGSFTPEEVPRLFPNPEPAPGDAVPAVALHNAPDARPITAAIVDLIESSRETLDVANPYLSDRPMIHRLRAAARRGVRVRLLVPAMPNNWASGSAQRFYHDGMLADGIEIWGFPTMLHAKALVRDGVDVLVGTCNLEVWSLRRFFEINLRLQSADLAHLFATRLFTPDIAVSEREGAPHGVKQRAVCAACAAAWPIV